MAEALLPGILLVSPVPLFLAPCKPPGQVYFIPPVHAPHHLVVCIGGEVVAKCIPLKT